ncbi:hypothetical protein EIN_097900 [Entamoeba invadens IP1]|uniref:Rho-GAP domain-containing protein n=1 Tax=Entamoeba invadens IP1 TaxID=370355 RepID=A0A0A1U465_ENTIV|nr:hypothetical protein EIN_097900 [Entamoeba invadens IP1]ELP87503.1 hypothetical protein EIN_097900 [Entamoeba invadens IP1]|eukprot:XP_004254274.1 hypothetical protein EIN_097900 [Entamoeba invadens IP1]
MLSQDPHKLTQCRYSNNFQNISNSIISKTQSIVTNVFSLMLQMQELQCCVEELKSKSEGSLSSTSFNHQLKIFSTTNESVCKICHSYQNALSTLGDTLKMDLWEEELSEDGDVKMQQLYFKTRITTYIAFSKCLSKFSDVHTNITSFLNYFSKEDIQKIQKVSNSLKEERMCYLKCNFKESNNTQIFSENEKIPPAIMKCMYTLYYTPQPIEGIFRKSPVNKTFPLTVKYIGALDVQCLQPDDIAGVIRNYLLEIGSLWESKNVPLIIEATIESSIDESEWICKVQNIVCTIPQHKQNMLKHILSLCGRITQNATSKMTSYNLAVCIGLSVLVPDDCVDMIKDETQIIIKAFELMENYREELFPDISETFKTHLNIIYKQFPIYEDVFCNKRNMVLFKAGKPNLGERKSIPSVNIGNHMRSVV